MGPAEEVSATNVAAFEDFVSDEKRNMEKLEEKKRRIEQIERLCRLRDRLKLEKRSEEGAISLEEFEVEARKAKADKRRKEQEEDTPKCWNCDREFSQTTSVIRNFNSFWPGLALLRAILMTSPNYLP